MSRPTIITTPVVIVPATACVELGPALVRLRDSARTNGVQLNSETVAAIEAIDTLGAAYRNGWRGDLVPQSSAEVPQVDDSGSAPAESMAVKHAAEELNISERAVRKRLTTGTLAGQKVGGSWRVDVASVRTLKESAA